jgi:hypothetical protein
MEPVMALALLQGGYYAVMACWALLHLQGFMRLTGAKSDVWLVKTVAALVLVIGAALLAGAWRGRIGPDLSFIAIGTAGALAIVDVVYVAKGTIARVYLLDALIEGLLLSAWLLVGLEGGGSAPPLPTP